MVLCGIEYGIDMTRKSPLSAISWLLRSLDDVKLGMLIYNHIIELSNYMLYRNKIR